MQINNAGNPAFWLCPACQKPLEQHNSLWRCANNHSFDRAKEGYVNLLLVQQKGSKDPGDNKDMVLARRTFLQQDHYLPLANELARLLSTYLGKDAENLGGNRPFAIYDAGCGEGYYLSKIKHQLATEGLSLLATGSDISKPAIQKAAKKNPDIHYAVASSFNLPVASASQDALVQIFAPADVAEIQRILKTEGLWLRVSPASHHLFELKEFVYQYAAAHEAALTIPAGFELLTHSHLQFKLRLNTPEQRENLLMMTPFYWTISAQQKALLLKKLSTVSADFDINVMLSKPD